jgi:hypothetical protein
MRNLFIAAIFLCLLSIHSFAQECPINYRDGGKITLTVKTWTNPLMADQKFLKAKEDKKEEQIKVYNADINSGKIAPTKYSFSYNIKKDEGADKSFTLTANLGGKDYSSKTICSDDTILFYRNVEPVKMESNGQILGYAIQGAQKIPVKIKVGDRLPKYEDVGIMFPATTDENVRVRLFSHNATKTKTDVTTYQSGSNEITTVTKKQTFTYPVFTDIDATLRQTLDVSSHFIHYAVALVSATEKISFAGKEYDAFIIDSEWWNKLAMKATYDAANKAVAKAHQDLIQQAQEGIAKRLHKKWGFTNEQGYAVWYKKEWFVPELGIVKTHVFDQYGGLQSETVVDTIE